MYKKFSIYLLLIFTVFGAHKAWSDVRHIDALELKALLDENVALVDVRRADEWQSFGVVDSTIKQTFFDAAGNYNVQQWLESVFAEVDQDQPVILICHTGVRSKLIADWLDKNKLFSQVYNVRNGIDEWIRRGLPVVKE